jgi:DNA-binding transcriptional LysR family regulator
MAPDLNLLSVFEAVARLGSVTAAANRLALSQPAVSHALNRLRATVRDPLFTRSGRGLVPTPRAVAMLAPARDVLAEAAALLAPQSFRPGQSKALFRIGASDYAALTLVPALARLLQNEAPQVALEIAPVGGDTLRQLEEGALDLSFWGAQPPTKPFHHRVLFEERYLGAARAGHPVFGPSGKGRVTLSRYLGYPHAVVSLRDPGANAFDQALALLGRPRRIGLASHSFAGNMASLETSDFIASLPSRLCRTGLARGLRMFKLPLEVPPYSYGLVWHQRTHAAAGHMWLRDAISAVS